jgi:hypothetical protein
MMATQTVVLVAAFLASVRIAGAQVLNIEVGVPTTSSPFILTDALVVDVIAYEGQATPIVGDPPIYPFTTTFPGDLVLTSSGDAPSDWLADIRFFNPLDPTGALGLPATEMEAFFPADLGPGGFNTFQLMPDYNVVDGFSFLGIPGITGAEVIFGPLGGILSDQEVEFIFNARPDAGTSTPEPGGPALLFGAGAVAVGCFAHRRRRFHPAGLPGLGWTSRSSGENQGPFQLCGGC